MTNKEAIEKLKGILTEVTEYENSVCYVTEEDREPLEMAIEALERRKAHWNYTLSADRDSWIVKCSCCGYERLEILDTRYGLKEIKIVYAGELKQDKYCLNCGAKIEGEQK